ncbi:serine/threonine protein kinase, CMGC, dual-specificity [Sorochytrium milnesiophthora]
MALVLNVFHHELSPAERAEIVHHDCVYYWGQTWKQTPQGAAALQQQQQQQQHYLPSLHTSQPGDSISSATSSSSSASASSSTSTAAAAATIAALYDDSKGDYIVRTGDHIAYRYEIMEPLGKGSFGQVLRVLDHATGTSCALKIIRNRRRFTMQGEIECQILRTLQQADPEYKCNSVRMFDSFKFRHHLCITFELLSINLYEFIKSNEFRGFSVGLIRRQKIIHCDLKPENVLLVSNNKSHIKVIDFGSSCRQHEKLYTYIQSRFYRSPEVILGIPYTMAVDMWSLGCMLAELFTGFPLFPGDNEHDQLSCIMEISGLPESRLLDKCERRNLFFDANNKPLPAPPSSSSSSSSSSGSGGAPVKLKYRRPGSRTLAQAIKCKDDMFLDFISQCLIWNPETRMTPSEALQHPWIVGEESASGSQTAGKAPSGNMSSRAPVGDPNTPTFRTTADRKGVSSARRNSSDSSSNNNNNNIDNSKGSLSVPTSFSQSNISLAMQSTSTTGLTSLTSSNSSVPSYGTLSNTGAKVRSLPPITGPLGVTPRIHQPTSSSSSVASATSKPATNITRSLSHKAASMTSLIPPPAPSASRSYKTRASWAAAPTMQDPLLYGTTGQSQPFQHQYSYSTAPQSFSNNNNNSSSTATVPSYLTSASAASMSAPTTANGTLRTNLSNTASLPVLPSLALSGSHPYSYQQQSQQQQSQQQQQQQQQPRSRRMSLSGLSSTNSTVNARQTRLSPSLIPAPGQHLSASSSSTATSTHNSAGPRMTSYTVAAPSTYQRIRSGGSGNSSSAANSATSRQSLQQPRYRDAGSQLSVSNSHDPGPGCGVVKTLVGRFSKPQ